MNKRIVFLDIICYAAIPYLLWNYGKEPLGDYWAIILSTVPGFIYTIYRFVHEKQFNILGIFIISSLLIDTTVNLLSSSAESMLWNQVYLGYGYGAIFLLSIIVKKPLALYFMVDYAYLMGYPRKNSIAFYNRSELFACLQWLTSLFVLRSVVQNSLKAWLLSAFGVDAYGQMLIYLKISSWIFGGIIMIGFIIVGNRISQLNEKLYSTKASS